MTYADFGIRYSSGGGTCVRGRGLFYAGCTTIAVQFTSIHANSLQVLEVTDGDRRPRDAHGGENRAVLLNINHSRACCGHRAGGSLRKRIGDLDRPKVGERRRPIARLEVLDNPLRVRLAQRRSRIDSLGYMETLGEVRDERRAGCRARRNHCERHGVARSEDDILEVVRNVREPLIPCCRVIERV